MGKVVAALVAIAIGLGVVLFVVLQQVSDTSVLPLELAKALISLITAVLITGILSFVLAQYSARRASAEERARALVGALQELKMGYERVQVARFVLDSNLTARTLEEQVPRISEARSNLHRVQRERFVLGTDVEEQAQKMLDALNGVFDEYRSKRSDLVRSALVEQRAEKEYLDGTIPDPPPLERLSATSYPAVSTFVARAGWRHSEFHWAYRTAKRDLEAQLDDLAGRTPLRERLHRSH